MRALHRAGAGVGGGAAVDRGPVHAELEIESAFEAGYPADAIEHQVVELVKTSGAIGAVIISTLRPLRRIAAMDAPAAMAYLSFYHAIKAFSWHPHCSILTHDQVDHAAGLEELPSTPIDTTASAKKALPLGVDGLICNELRVMRAV